MLRVGVDIGGTFTDITILDDLTGEITSDKVLTTPKDPSVAVLEGLKQMGTDLKEVSFLVHGTTVSINALIEHKGSRTGLITTKGFEGVLEIGRGNRTVFFDIFYQRPVPLAPRRWRLGVSERTDARGEGLEPLDLEEATAAIDRLASQGVQSVAVCFFHSFKNAAHERQVKDLILSRYPHIDVSLSSDVLPEIREYERMSTTVANGYLKPVIRAYLENLEASLGEMCGGGGVGEARQGEESGEKSGMAVERGVGEARQWAEVGGKSGMAAKPGVGEARQGEEAGEKSGMAVERGVGEARQWAEAGEESGMAAERGVGEARQGAEAGEESGMAAERGVGEAHEPPLPDAPVQAAPGTFSVRGPALHVMQSNGGIMTAEMAKQRPVQIVESGPVGGAVAAAYIVEGENIIAFDMGGTTSKANVIHGGVMQTTTEYWPAGYMVKIPVVDIVEVGIGGGSIGWINAEGFLAVGPLSAGADPGPVCYDLGGTDPTITDANAVLGRVEQLVGGRIRLNSAKALRAIETKIAGPLGMAPIAAAVGILEIAVAKMADNIRTVTVARGIDPRDFTLCAFGGAGPMHAAFIARELNIPLTIIPPAPGTFSGLGFLCSDFRHDFVQTFLMNTESPDVSKAGDIFVDLERKGTEVLRQEAFSPQDIALFRSLDMRYVGQAHEVNVPMPVEPRDLVALGGAFAAIAGEFHRRHEEQFGHSAPGEPAEVVNLRVTAIGRVKRPAIRYNPGADSQARLGQRRVYFQEAGGWLDCPLYRRSALAPATQIRGPAILEEHTSTVVVPPDFRAEINAYGNVALQR